MRPDDLKGVGVDLSGYSATGLFKVLAVVGFLLGMLGVSQIGVCSQSGGAAIGLQTLRAGQYPLLDKELNAFQRQYDQGKLSDVELLAYFRALDTDDPDDEPFFKAWLKQFPQSYSAHTATGIFYRRVAGDLSAGAPGTEQESIRQAYIGKAQEQFRQSLSLASKPVVSYVMMIAIADFTRDHLGPRDVMDQALKVSPSSFIARREYMYVLHSSIRGGVLAQKGFLKESEGAGLSAKQMQVLSGMALTDEGIALQFQKQYSEAWKTYKRGLMLLDQNRPLLDAECLPCLYGHAASIANDADDYASGLVYANRMLRVQPSSYDAHLYRAIALYGLSRLADAIPDLQIAARYNSWAKQTLQFCYLNGIGVPRDLKKAQELGV